MRPMISLMRWRNPFSLSCSRRDWQLHFACQWLTVLQWLCIFMPCVCVCVCCRRPASVVARWPQFTVTPTVSILRDAYSSSLIDSWCQRSASVHWLLMQIWPVPMATVHQVYQLHACTVMLVLKGEWAGCGLSCCEERPRWTHKSGQLSLASLRGR